MRYLRAFLRAILIILLALLPALFVETYNIDFYRNFQDQYSISERSGKSEQELDEINKDLIGYLKDGKSQRMLKHFSNNECLHMVDVYELFNLARSSLIVCLVLYIVMIGKVVFKPDKYRIYTGRFVLTIFALFSLIAISAYLNWNKTFTIFHKILFSNDLWLMDPSKDLMIKILPAEFFINMAESIAIRALFYLLIFYGLYSLALFVSRLRQNYLRSKEIEK